jgi:hypothetical protein
VNAVIILRVLQNEGNFFTSLATISFTRTCSMELFVSLLT